MLNIRKCALFIWLSVKLGNLHSILVRSPIEFFLMSIDTIAITMNETMLDQLWTKLRPGALRGGWHSEHPRQRGPWLGLPLHHHFQNHPEQLPRGRSRPGRNNLVETPSGSSCRTLQFIFCRIESKLMCCKGRSCSTRQLAQQYTPDQPSSSLSSGREGYRQL
jgi:hypothetical protein